ncbi:hypothetical protein ACHAWF_011452 [Thalassiosira exigua]
MTGSSSRIHSLLPEWSRLLGGKHEIVGLVTASLLFGAAWIWLRKRDQPSADDSGDSWAEAAAKTAVVADGNSRSGDGKRVEAPSKLRNVFSVKQKPISTGNGSSGKQKSSDRPFESSYYFAHNKHSTGGGYKDGLRAEDYVMNGPRLLSKGGVQVNDERNEDENDSNSDGCTQSEASDAREKAKAKVIASTPISKYMWDDDANGNVAKIHIDSLPISSTETIKWENAGISKRAVDVRLIGENKEGLYVRVTWQGKRYHLHVPKMYGEAESVKCIVKRHKLLVKISKKMIPRRSRRHEAEGEGVWNLATKALAKLSGGGDGAKDYISLAWPRLSASSAGGPGGGTAEIDQDLFKKMDGEDDAASDFERLGQLGG